jgi:hypothetical protein
MRLSYLLAVISCAVFGSAIAVPRQDEPTAEKQFKNITSFKGSKASDVIPAMEFMSASHGVGCDYCHTDDRSSDEKGPKNTAREMIAMQRDINTKNFRGRNIVTCASCHAGHTRPVAVPPTEGGQIRTRRSPDVKPDEVLTAYSKAIGGDPSHLLSGIRLAGTNFSNGEHGKVDAIYAGEEFTYATKGTKVDQKLGFNGKVAWFVTPKGLQQVPVVYAIQFLRRYTLFAGTTTLPKLTNPTGGTAKLGDRDVVVVSGVIAGDTTRASLYFDKKTGLLARTLFGYPTTLGTIIQTNDYSDYRKVDGVEIPMSITNHSAEGDMVTKYTSAKLEPKVDPKMFDPAK